MATIRRMTIEDYPALLELWSATDGVGLNSLDDSEEGIARYLRRNPTTCFVALSGESVIGTILAGHDGRRGYIHHTAVLDAFRGRGIGGKLVEQALSELRKEAITKVALVVFKGNSAGNAFWQRVGFEDRTDLIYRNRALT